jgi:hypothetical protein
MPSSETLTGSLRRRLRETNPACPTCGQPTGQSLRALGEATGVPFTVLGRFLKGADMTGRNLDKIDAFLREDPNAQ